LNIYELYGHKIEEYETLLAQMFKTLQLLRNIQSKSVEIDDVIIKENGWELKK